MAKRKLKTIECFNPEWDIKNEGIPVAQFTSLDKGYDYYIESIHYSVYCADGLPVDLTVQLSDNNQFGQQSYSSMRVLNGPGTIQYRKIVRAASSELKIACNNTGINLGRQIVVNVWLSAVKFPQLSQFNEENVIYCLGDSIDVLNGYVTKVAGHRNYQMLNKLRENGFSCRLASLAISGRSLDEYVRWFKTGYGQIRKADVILLQMGANDIGQNVTNAKFLENLVYMKTWRDSLYPDAKIVVCKAAPSNESGQYGADGIVRNNVQRGYNLVIDNFLTTYHDQNMYSIDVFSQVPQDPLLWADGVHFTQQGHDLQGAILGNGMKTILGL